MQIRLGWTGRRHSDALLCKERVAKFNPAHGLNPKTLNISGREKTQNIKTLNPKSPNPTTLSIKTLNPKSLNLKTLNSYGFSGGLSGLRITVSVVRIKYGGGFRGLRAPSPFWGGSKIRGSGFKALGLGF